MAGELLVIGGLFLVPFFLTATMPGWRSLGVIAAITAIYGIWLYWFKEIPHGMGGVLELLLYWLVFWGLAMGVANRTFILTMRRYNVPRWANALISVNLILTGAAIVFFLIR